MDLVYNWDKCHIYRTKDAYLIVPYEDVTFSRVPVDEFQRAQKKAKQQSKEDATWREIKLTSSSGID